MVVAQASPPASSGGVPPPVGMFGFIAASVPCTGTVQELAAGDGCATLPRQLIDLAIEALVLGPDVAPGFQECAEGLGGGGRFGFLNGHPRVSRSRLRHVSGTARVHFQAAAPTPKSCRFPFSRE